jgi:Predicted transmembrane sensor domain
VGISEADIQALGRFLMAKFAIAQTLTKLPKYLPKAIGLDLYRDWPQQPRRKELLAQLLRDTRRSTVVCFGNGVDWCDRAYKKLYDAPSSDGFPEPDCFVPRCGHILGCLGRAIANTRGHSG